VNEPLVVSLAILKVNWDRGQDYVANYVPFVGECLRKAPQDEISLADLQAALKTEFGLGIPQNTLRTVLRRAVKAGYVTQTAGIYRRNMANLAKLDLGNVRAQILRECEALLDKLIAFCESRHKVVWPRQEAEAAILSYLQEHSTPILASVVDGLPIPPATGASKRADFLVNAFIADLFEHDPEGFEFLEALVKGSLLANAMFFADIGGVPRRFDRVDILFDTAFLLRALGFVGERMQAPCRELIELVYEQNGTPKCFEHTFHEMLRVLGAAAQAVLNPQSLRAAHGDVIEYFITTRSSASDIELMIARLEKSLRAIRVQVRPLPAHTLPLGVDETKLEGILQDEVRYRKDEALRHDLDAVTAVFRLRHGEFPIHVEACYALFITTNRSLARASARFLKEEYSEEYTDHPPYPVPPCMLDEFFTNLVWLKQPFRAPDLPRKRILADCFAALNPSDQLWRRYLQQIDALERRGDISGGDYALLRFSTVARSAVMDATLGDPDAFTEGTVQDVLEAAQAAARAETEVALRAEKERREEAERRVAAAEATLTAREQRQASRFRDIGAVVGRSSAQILMYGATVVLAVGVYLTLPRPFPPIPPAWQRLVAPAILLLLSAVGALTIANLALGTTLRSLLRRLEVSISRWVEQALARIVGR